MQSPRGDSEFGQLGFQPTRLSSFSGKPGCSAIYSRVLFDRQSFKELVSEAIAAAVFARPDFNESIKDIKKISSAADVEVQLTQLVSNVEKESR